MLDIETLGTEVGAPILSIGAVRFSLTDVPPLFKPDIKVAKKLDPDAFYRRVTLKSNMAAGLTEVTQGSVDFWLQQADDVRLELLEARVPIREALGDLWKWIDMEDYNGIWAHGTTFDFPILARGFIAVYDRTPWRYKAIRDTRTLFSIAYPDEALPETYSGLNHNALFDAFKQAKQVQSCYERINKWRMTPPST